MPVFDGFRRQRGWRRGCITGLTVEKALLLTGEDLLQDYGRSSRGKRGVRIQGGGGGAVCARRKKENHDELNRTIRIGNYGGRNLPNRDREPAAPYSRLPDQAGPYAWAASAGATCQVNNGCGSGGGNGGNGGYS